MADLTKDEQANVRTALRFLRARCGGWGPVAKALHVAKSTIENTLAGHRNVSAAVAVRVARLAGVSIDGLLAGEYPPPGTCPYCGHCAGDDGAADANADARAAR